MGLFEHWVGTEFDWVARIALAEKCLAPRSEEQCSEFGRSAVSEMCPKRWQHELWNAAGAVHCEAQDLISHLRVREALQQAVDVGVEVHAFNWMKRGLGFAIEVGLDERKNVGVGHTVVHEFDLEEVSRESENRVTGVEQLQLHVFERTNIFGDDDVEGLPRRAFACVVIFDNPLDEWLAHHWPVVADADGVSKPLTIGWRGGGRDSIDHRVGEAHVGFDPCGELGVVGGH